MTDHHAEVAHRWKELARIAAGIAPTKIPLDPCPSHILSVKDDLDVLIDKFDPLLLAIGEMLVANGMDKRNLRYFRNQLRDALQGNASYCIDELADAVRDRLMEAVA